ncbi:alpha-L-arabinofuranosidase C-terminal domain-containing protein [Streptomyces mutabilis]|uniref:alpha-L-arabinofuranosidase C-terminal domain-containing protein n=1 Tax=Streptomyces TaxID=1883 RepID=UPI0036AF3E02
MVAVVLDPRRTIGPVSPLVFGSFVENLHRCVYGGVYDPDSPVADACGFRTDVIDAARAMGVTNVRFPGGCYAAYYHWKDGVGPTSERPSTRYRADGTWPAANDFGTDEFMAWCQEARAEPYLCVNMGTGTPEEARDWVEYCNGEPGSRWADERVRNGHPEPYSVRYWALGNEISGAWEMGYTATPEEYVRRARDFATAMKAADPTIRLVLSGAHFPIGFPQPNWNRDVLYPLYEHTDFISMHHYIGHDYADDIRERHAKMGVTAVFEHLTEYMRLLEDAVDVVRQDIRLVNHDKGSPGKPIGIALDEYNPWYKTGDDPQCEDGLTEVYHLADSLLVAAYFGIFLRNADVLALANMAQLVNTLPAVVCESGGKGFYRQGISYVQELFAASRGHTAIDVWADSPVRKGSYYPSVPLLDVSASHDEASGEVLLYAVNRDPERPLALEVTCPAGPLAPHEVATVGGGPLDTANTFAEPERITIRHRPADAGTPLTVPPATVIRVRLRPDPAVRR